MTLPAFRRVRSAYGGFGCSRIEDAPRARTGGQEDGATVADDRHRSWRRRERRMQEQQAHGTSPWGEFCRCRAFRNLTWNPCQQRAGRTQTDRSGEYRHEKQKDGLDRRRCIRLRCGSVVQQCSDRRMQFVLACMQGYLRSLPCLRAVGSGVSESILGLSRRLRLLSVRRWRCVRVDPDASRECLAACSVWPVNAGTGAIDRSAPGDSRYCRPSRQGRCRRSRQGRSRAPEPGVGARTRGHTYPGDESLS